MSNGNMCIGSVAQLSHVATNNRSRVAATPIYSEQTSYSLFRGTSRCTVRARSSTIPVRVVLREPTMVMKIQIGDDGRQSVQEPSGRAAVGGRWIDLSIDAADSRSMHACKHASKQARKKERLPSKAVRDTTDTTPPTDTSRRGRLCVGWTALFSSSSSSSSAARQTQPAQQALLTGKKIRYMYR